MAARNNPGGGKGQDKQWSDAIRVAAFEKQKGKNGQQKLRLAAQKLVDLAVEGDMAALKEMGDRLDGKPTQTHEGTPEHPIEHVHRIIIGPRNPDA